MSAKKSALGRGLGALITMDDLTTGGSSSINEIELSKIQPNPDQPRTFFDQEALEELAASIRSLGIVQPITLREISPDSYQIISGERRYRASLMAGLEAIPAYVKTAEDDNVMEMALIENIQREDLNAIEISLAYQKLLDTHSLTQEQLSDRIGKKRATIANYLRLLKLPANIQIGLKNKMIDMGHARTLVSIADPAVQLDIYEKILKQQLSVRSVEEMVRKLSEEKVPATEKPQGSNIDFAPLQKGLSKFFKTDVKLTCDEKGKGKITIAFKSDTELYQIIDLIDDLKN